jgi:hypothetical protein
LTRVLPGASPVPIGPRSSQEILSKLPPSPRLGPIRPIVDRMIKDIVREIRGGVPAYAQPLDSELGKVLVSCVERAAQQVVHELGNPGVDRAAWANWFRHVGRLEYLEGRNTDAVQTAIRIGSRVAWRHVQAAGTRSGAPAATLYALADALFQYADDLSAAIVAGHCAARAHASGDLDQRRHRLLKLILSDPPIAPQAIAEQAGLCEWTVPDRVSVVVLDVGTGPGTDTGNFGREVLADLTGAEPCLVVGNPERRLLKVEQALAGWTAAIGPAVSIAEAPRSLACARRVLALARRGVLPRRQVLRCAEHLPTLAMYADEFVLARLTEHALGPFAGLTDKQRVRLEETLLAWLSSRGGFNDVADRLGVHPQTVRYRMNQVDELLGDRLDDPDERLMLEIALRTNRHPRA